MSRSGKSMGMSFSDAIPLNRLSDSASSYSSSVKRGSFDSEWSRETKQKVNISKKTAFKAAQSKLNNALMHKLAYGNSGKIGVEPTVGQLFEAKA
ncbi:hypothetical protein MLD52_12260 [Puniceicoccaceae bacterium K14]|nr:hypothetical protein [Puniceicoccaceae bacterium K14]